MYQFNQYNSKQAVPKSRERERERGRERERERERGECMFKDDI